MSKRKLVLLAAMLAILVLGIAMPAAAQLNTGNVQNTQGVVQYKGAADDTGLTGTNSGSPAGDTSLTGTNSDSAASDNTDDTDEEACQKRITDVLKSEFRITLEDEDDEESLEELCDR
jgi:hypothetical protein